MWIEKSVKFVEARYGKYAKSSFEMQLETRISPIGESDSHYRHKRDEKINNAVRLVKEFERDGITLNESHK